MSDSLACGGKVRTLNLIDEGSREGLAIEAASSIGSNRAIRVLERVIEARGTKPKAIRSDNGPEFTSVAFTEWCKDKGIVQAFIQKGKPMQNGYMERFNGSFRTEVLDMYLFTERWQVQEHAGKWLLHYNTQRPHEGLNNQTPCEWAKANTRSLGGGTPAQGTEPQNQVTILYNCLENGALTLATKGSGIVKLDINTGATVHFTEVGGLTNNTVYFIAPDQKGFFWCSSNKGLFRFNPANGDVTYSTANLLVTPGVLQPQFSNTGVSTLPAAISGLLYEDSYMRLNGCVHLSKNKVKYV